MSFVFPGAPLPWLDRRFTDAAGVPLALGSIESYAGGTSTPLATYSDAALTTPNAVTLTLNANGCAPAAMYLLPVTYKFIVKDVNGVVQPHYPVDNVGSDGQILAEYFGLYAYAGSKTVVSGYTALVTDHVITVSSTGGPDPCIINLFAASLARWPLTIKNIGTLTVKIVPNGLDTVELLNAFRVMRKGVSPIFPAITLASDNVSAWMVTSSHGFSVFN